VNNTKGETMRRIAIPIVVLISLAFVMPAHAANNQGPHCTGADTTVGTDYTFSGSGFHANTAYVVTITVPNQSSFSAVAFADNQGHWNEFWLANMAGTYTASVAPYKAHASSMATCSLVTR
jgi:hypothetical protein